MARVVYSEAELLSEHDYARPHEEAGYRLHGGFDRDGRYISPRMLGREPAVRAWQHQLAERGWPLVDASVDLLERANYPTVTQQRFLLHHGVDRSLWNSLSITGTIEARGRLLAEFTPPDFQAVVLDDISGTATGHLAKGLLVAHGWDEGGDPSTDLGAHDAMWFAVRDMLLGADAHPLPEIPESIGRPEGGRRMPALPEEHEGLLLLLMNVLMIEVRAASIFAFYTDVIADPDLFTDRRADADLAIELIGRIRADEAIHVDYLRTVVSELRSFTLRSVDGEEIAGRDVIDPVWGDMVRWHAVTRADEMRTQTRDALGALLAERPDGARLLAEMDALEAA